MSETGNTIRLTAAQAMVRWLAAQRNEDGARFIAGVWAIFGHGNVAGLGEALEGASDSLPTWRGQNEQTMAHAAIAYAKAKARRQAMCVTSSIGPGATNMVTAAALAHVNRLPLLLVPGDVFANRRPDPVLQQVEDFTDGTVSANDCFRPVSRYFDRIARPEQLLTALPRAMRVMTDPAECGPVTLAFCQDVQVEAYDWPVSFFEERVWRIRRPEPDAGELAEIASLVRGARAPVIVCGGGVIYSGAQAALSQFAERHGILVVETQAGKSALPQAHELNFGAAGVDGAASANQLCEAADLVIGVGTRFQDFTTGSWTLFQAPGRRLVSLNVQPYDAAKHGAVSLVADARVGLERLSAALGDHRSNWFDPRRRSAWLAQVDAHCAAPDGASVNSLPTDAKVIGAVQRASSPQTTVLCAAGTMPGALKLLWQASAGGYHMEYGYSCMGYELAGALGAKMAMPDREIVCFTGDGSYMMANSELATAVMMRMPFTVVLTDNRGFGCINRLQAASGGEPFNNLYRDCQGMAEPEIDFVAHAASMGAHAEKVDGIATLEAAVRAARERDRPSVIVIDTDPAPGPGEAGGGHWWDVAVPEAPRSAKGEAALASYSDNRARQNLVD